MVAHSSLGQEGAPFVLEVERGKIHEFARAVQSQHPAYFEDEAPVCPPTFLTTRFFWNELVPGSDAWDLVQMDQKRGMHAEQEYIFHGPPPRAGTRLIGTSKITKIFEKQGRRGGTMTFAVMETEYHTEDGTLVATARLTGVETGRPPEEGS
jgi:hypothetical protein